MSVVVLMYHHTPETPDGFYDVSFSTFRDQIRALLEAGVSFVKFSECDRPEYVERGRHVALTFDDGHATNETAFRFLADYGVVPTAFVVRDWSTQDARYLSPAALAALKGICELGGHGASHRGLTSLTDLDLGQELATSRDFVASLAGTAETMALPGGHGGQRELAAAGKAGFRLIGNSRPLPHGRLSASVNRICVNRTHDVEAPLRWVEAGDFKWGLRRARFAATATGRRVLGGRLYGALTALAK
jgi:peptidoglycan/xylan/chitin deacetylase (PgdA/CDA1 family)